MIFKMAWELHKYATGKKKIKEVTMKIPYIRITGISEIDSPAQETEKILRNIIQIVSEMKCAFTD
jgi:hypothetical protein